MTPWHRRRLHTRPGGTRRSAAARLWAHDLALRAWMRSSRPVKLRSTAILSPYQAVALRTRHRRPRRRALTA